MPDPKTEIMGMTSLPGLLQKPEMDESVRIFLLSGGITFSTKDVFDGFVDGLKRCLVAVSDYTLFGSLLYFSLEFACRDILGELADVRNHPSHVIVIDGLHPPVWFLRSIHERLKLPTAVIATEDPHGFDQTQERFMDETCYDFYFTNERNVAEMFPGRAVYLPVGFNAALTHRVATELPISGMDYSGIDSDICFVGACYANRQQLFEEMLPFFKKHDLKVRLMGHFGMVDKESPLWTSGYVYNATLPFRDTLQVYMHSNMAINLFRDPTGVTFGERSDKQTNQELQIPADSLNPRCYEVPACGCLLLTEDKRGETKTVFEPGKEIDIFSDREELETKILYYMEHEDERKAICKRAQKKVWDNHTYHHRAQRVLKVLKETV